MAAGLSEETLQVCPVCHAADAVLIFTYPEQYMPAGVLHVFRCQRCLSSYLNPRLTIESTIAVENESTIYELTATEVEERIAGAGALLSGLPGPVPRHGRLLDIGCNRGLLLEAARRQGWEVVGVELSPVAAQRARDDFGLEIYGSLDGLKQHDGFDVIFAWHVLEHTHDPVGFLRDAGSLLRSNGVLALQVPSFDFVEEFLARSQIYSITCAAHAFYFTEQNIRPILSRAGLAAQFVLNNPDDLMLTVISTREPQIELPRIPAVSRAPSTLSRRVYESLRYRGARSLVRETRQYLKWRWHLLRHPD